MEIKNLRYFLAVAREENMSHAAEILHVTQPTLSKVLKSLEDELGKKLFTRHSFSIKLTDEGMLLRDRAEDLVAMADKIEQEFISLDDITGGDIYFGLAESYQISLLAREIKKLKDRYPNFTYHITSGDTEQVTEKLDKGLLDFGVICETPNTDKYEYLVFPDSDLWGAVMLKTHPLAKKKSTLLGSLFTALNKAGILKYRNGLENTIPNSIWKALSGFLIMPLCLQKKVSAFSLLLNISSTVPKKAILHSDPCLQSRKQNYI